MVVAERTASPYRSTTSLPATTWPRWSAQAGEGRQRAAAAASLNSALVRDVSGLGRAWSHTEDSLSR